MVFLAKLPLCSGNWSPVEYLMGIYSPIENIIEEKGMRGVADASAYAPHPRLFSHSFAL
jgi:hypothetical protein